MFDFIALALKLMFFKIETYFTYDKIHLFIYLFHFWPLQGIWSSRARDQIHAAASSYTTAQATLDPLTHCARPGD